MMNNYQNQWGNYGYSQPMYANGISNQYGQYISNQQGLIGKQVRSFDEISANDVPMNVPFAIFPKEDGSEIEIRSWNANGTISTTLYKPYFEQKNNQENIKSMIAEKTDFEPIMERLNSIEDMILKISQPNKRTTVKKESVE